MTLAEKEANVRKAMKDAGLAQNAEARFAGWSEYTLSKKLNTGMSDEQYEWLMKAIKEQIPRTDSEKGETTRFKEEWDSVCKALRRRFGDDTNVC